MINQIGTATDKSALKNNILNSLEKIKNTALQNKDAAALKTAAIYYGKIHEHGKAEECENLADNFNGTTSAKIINGSNIPDTNLNWTLDDEGTLTISGNDDLNSNPKFSFAGLSHKVKKIVFESGVTSIGNNLFNGYRNLTSITFPAGLKTIEYFAFSYCYNLEHIEFLGSLDEIQGGAFKSCTILKEIKFNGAVTKICGGGHGAFANCKSLTSINLPYSLKIIERRAFENCTALTEIKIPPSVQQIDIKIFDGCENLKVINYPRGLQSAGKLGNGNNAKLITY